MIKLLGPTVKKVEENTKRIEALEIECQKQFNDIDAKIVREVKENTEDIIDSKVKDAWTTEKERAKRARNIIISNFPEPTVQKEQKSEKDREEVEKLLKDHMKLKDTDFTVVAKAIRKFPCSLIKSLMKSLYYTGSYYLLRALLSLAFCLVRVIVYRLPPAEAYASSWCVS